MDPDLVDDQSPANGAMEMDRSNASENVLALPELPPEVLDIIVRYSGVRSMIKLAQVSESFYVTVQKWADERKHLKLGCFLRYMDEAPGQEQVLFLLRLFRNLEGLSIDRWKWWVGQSMIKWVCVLSPCSLTPCRSCNHNKGTIRSRYLQFCYRELHIGTLEEL
mmetsp:Transcript_35069/g.139254  ORF Transcript_35069/g.139254 Transcript_35069/m.139254 type:complete len:164 (-) Transcript_35069:910-1401(-)